MLSEGTNCALVLADRAANPVEGRYTGQYPMEPSMPSVWPPRGGVCAPLSCSQDDKNDIMVAMATLVLARQLWDVSSFWLASLAQSKGGHPNIHLEMV